ncbi:MAG: hypothetical protein EOO38_20630 [Cytophagaceae bacterium]|nr:MAG: hypothetical protein EOO38_20630 [Cytophagaceae bacterium]
MEYTAQGHTAKETSDEEEKTYVYNAAERLIRYVRTSAGQGTPEVEDVSQGQVTNSATRIHYLHTDHLGTPVLRTNKQGATTWKAVTEAFGATGTLPESLVEMNLRFPGQYWDGESGTHYNFNRNYNVDTARYSQSDPIGLEGAWNLFAYAFGNLNMDIDPSGLAVTGRWEEVPTWQVDYFLRGFGILYLPGSGRGETMSVSIIGTVGLARFYAQYDFKIKASVRCRNDDACGPMERVVPYEKDKTIFRSVDNGFNVPFGLYAASRGGGFWWVVAGIVVGTVANGVVGSFDNVLYLRSDIAGDVAKLYKYGPTFICNYGFPDV